MESTQEYTKKAEAQINSPGGDLKIAHVFAMLAVASAIYQQTGFLERQAGK